MYPTAEHLFQASKAPTQELAKWIREAPTPGEAKRRGRSVKLGGWWEREKRRIMLEIVLWKFAQNESLRAKLAATAPQHLIEGNTWGDRYWGMVPSASGLLSGENWLGRILMMAREVL